MKKIKKVHFKANLYRYLHMTAARDETGQAGLSIGIVWKIIEAVAKRAAELDDKELNKLMLRLGLYNVSNPEHEEYDLDAVEEYLQS